MEHKPCLNCGQPKHPLKACQNCGMSNLRREVQIRLSDEPRKSEELPRGKSYGLGFLGRNRLKQSHQSDDLDWHGWNETYGGAFEEDLPFFDISTFQQPSTNNLSSPRQSSLENTLPAFDETTLRLASRFKKAVAWLGETPTAILPMEKLWDVFVFDGWTCPATSSYAKRVILTSPEVSLRDLQMEILKKGTKAALHYPYVWWIGVDRCRMKALYKDAEGHPFIQYDNNWHLAYSLRDMGGLVGAKGIKKPQDTKVPRHGYFVCWENETMARNYYATRKSSQQEAGAVGEPPAPTERAS